jgi:hypothetical protein
MNVWGVDYIAGQLHIFFENGANRMNRTSGIKAGVVSLVVLVSGHAASGNTNRTHGLVGLRPLPRTQAMDHSHNHGGSWAGTPTFAEQQGNNPYRVFPHFPGAVLLSGGGGRASSVI